VDTQTLETYETHAVDIAARFRANSPDRLYRTILEFFHAAAPTADIGCGSGRDVAWLTDRGFQATGFEASNAMLREAHNHFRTMDLRSVSLPNLASIPDGAYSNVLCSAVLIHLERADLITAIFSIARILRPGGRAIISYRNSQSDSEREPDGRLFTPIPVGKLTLLLEAAGLKVITSNPKDDPQRVGIRWQTLLVEKSPLGVAIGLDRIQSVLVQDQKVATYKYALVRALCVISRVEAQIIHWSDNTVYIPLRSVAVRWLIYYWPLINHPRFIAQARGESEVSIKPIAFRETIIELAKHFGQGGLSVLLRGIEEEPLRYQKELRRIADTIRNGPVTFSGTQGPRLFSYESRLPSSDSSTYKEQFGWVGVPEPVWLDISRFGHWIEDSVVLRWAQLTAEMNRGSTAAEYPPLLLATPTDERDTTEVQALIRSARGPLECVWSGRPLGRTFQIDHVIPYSVWGNNDFWNLLPSLPQYNQAKSNALPTRNLLIGRQTCIIRYWHLYAEHWSHRFAFQIQASLGGQVHQKGWERTALAGLEEAIERLATSRGMARWMP
jgi:hypothetical protein